MSADLYTAGALGPLTVQAPVLREYGAPALQGEGSTRLHGSSTRDLPTAPHHRRQQLLAGSTWLQSPDNAP